MSKYFQKYQAITYYLMSIMVVAIIAARTNSLLSVKTTMSTVITLLALFTVISIVREKGEQIFVKNHPLLNQPKKQLIYELAIYLFTSTTLFIIEIFINNHSFIIACKFFSAVLIIGYFASVDGALNREHKCFQELKDSQSNVQNTTPVALRFSLFLTITLLVVIIANTLTAYSYMSINLDGPAGSGEIIKNAYLVETLFTLGIVVSLSLRLIHSYSLNLQYLFNNQINALQHIQDGKLEEYIPVLSRDEFGVIAQKMNSVIDELREKEKIRHTLESIVSPDIMRKLMHSDSNMLQHGESKHIAVFFCDLRKFTSYAEKNTSEDVIFFLNAYFSKIVDIVNEHNGEVNKFMGDAILAVFPLDDNTASIDDAIDTAWDIVMHSQAICLPDGERFNVGIGIHMGQATAGTIGSQNRFEYTFIGDTVNTASRLDGLSKRLGYSIIISDEVYQNVSIKMKERFIDLGEQNIRGKEKPLHVYGASTVQHISH